MLNGNHRYEPATYLDLPGDPNLESWADSEFKEDYRKANRNIKVLITKFKDNSCTFSADATSKDLKAGMNKN